MKKIITIIIAISTLPFLSCSTIIENQMELLGENLNELGEKLDENDSKYHYSINGYNSGVKVEINKNDKLKTRKFDIKEYNALNIGYSFQVVMCDTIDAVTVRVNEKLDKYLVVKVNNGTLTVTLDRIVSIKSDEARCGYVFLPYNVNINSFELNGTSSFATKLVINSDNIDINLSGASSFKAKVICKTYNADLSGSSHCRTNVLCEKAVADLSGASSMESNLMCNTLDADLSGSSKLKGNINTNESIIDADLSGASCMELAGTCQSAEIDLSGSSKLKCKKLKVKTLIGSMSGVSTAEINCSDHIKMQLTGTSNLTYYGTPKTDINASKSASIQGLRP